MRNLLIGLLLGLVGVGVAQVWVEPEEGFEIHSGFACSVMGCDLRTCHIQNPEPTTKWIGNPFAWTGTDEVNVHLQYEIGLRSDGVVVWKEVSVEKD